VGGEKTIGGDRKTKKTGGQRPLGVKGEMEKKFCFLLRRLYGVQGPKKYTRKTKGVSRLLRKKMRPGPEGGGGGDWGIQFNGVLTRSKDGKGNKKVKQSKKPELVLGNGGVGN